MATETATTQQKHHHTNTNTTKITIKIPNYSSLSIYILFFFSSKLNNVATSTKLFTNIKLLDCLDEKKPLTK